MTKPSLVTAHRRVTALAGAAAALAISLTACGSSSSTSASPPPSSSGAGSSSGASSSPAGGATSGDLAKYSAPVTDLPTIPPLAGVAAVKGKTVWYVPIGAAVPILSAFGSGMQDALSRAGITVHTCDGKFLPTTIASCLSQAASQGANGVVTGYVDYALVPSSFDNLVSHHIPVLVAGEAPDGGKTSSPALAFDDTTATINLAEKLDMESVIADSGGKAKILFLGVTDSPQTKQGAAYGKQFLTQTCPGCTINEIDYDTASINKVPSQVSAALISHPDTTYVVDELDAAGQGTVAGIQNAGYANKVKLAGANGDLDALQRIKSGSLQVADVGVGSTYIGWQFADGILRMLTGKTPEEGLGLVRVFNKSNVGSLTLTPSQYATNAWYGSDAFKRTFTSAWGLS